MAARKKIESEKKPRKQREKNAVVPVRTKVDENIISNIILRGDISGLNEAEKAKYNIELCKSLGLNPYTQPFAIIKFQGKETLYATKTATEQLRKVYGVSVTSLDRQILGDICVVTANVMDATGRTDASTGAVSIKGRIGNDLANDIMKAETKAKRRATLSICGLGMLDESEIETIGKHETKTITGEIITTQAEDTQIPPMTIEEACKKFREAENMRQLQQIKLVVWKSANWNSDDITELKKVATEMEAKFNGGEIQ